MALSRRAQVRMLHRRAAELEPQMSAAIVRGTRRLRRSISASGIERALTPARGRTSVRLLADRVFAEIEMDAVRESLSEAAEDVRRSFDVGGLIGQRQVNG